MFHIHTFMLSEVSMSRKRRRSPTAFEGALLYICTGEDRMVQTLQMGGKLGAIQTTFEYKGIPMLHYAVVFLVIALIAAVFGFGGIAAGAAGIAKILFVVFLIGAIVTFLMNGRSRV
jgi:uncharacterized membrane protein YtjA (UPF0391 family)